MIRLLSTAAVVAAFACQASSAQAMLIDALGETIQHSSSSLETTGAMAPAEEPHPESRPSLLWQDLLPQALYALGNANGGSTGMGSTASGGSSGPVQAAVCCADDESYGIIVAYLMRESKILLPVPFLDCVFRPPRA